MKRQPTKAGARYGRLTTLEDARHTKSLVRCACDCGSVKVTSVKNMKSFIRKHARTPSCGCMIAQERAPIGRPRITIPSGTRFGHWTLLEDAIGTQSGVLCRCVCGKERTVRPYHLRERTSTSCGCASLARKHGMSKKTAEYRIWAGIRTRCYNANHHSFPNYGGRGITLCRRWDDFANFYEDMGDRPSAAHSIERVDNDGPYDPSNCIWGTRREQSRNKRNNHHLTVRGVTKLLVEWADITGISRRTLLERLGYGWTHEDIVDRPSRPVRKPRPYPGGVQKRNERIMELHRAGMAMTKIAAEVGLSHGMVCNVVRANRDNLQDAA